MYDQAGNASYNPAPQATETVTAQAPLLDQTITVITSAPASAHAGDVFTVEATASSGLPVSYSASGDCSNAGSTFTFLGMKGVSCFVQYDQAGDGNYNPAPQETEEVTYVNNAPVIAEGDSIVMTIPRDGFLDLRLSATDADSNQTLTWSISSRASHGDTKVGKCEAKKGSGDSVCSIVYIPIRGYSGPDSFEVRVDDGNLADTITVNVTIGATMLDQTITVTTSAPAGAQAGDVFTVAANASSGLPVSYSSSGACTNAGAEFTMTGGTGTCTVMYDQAGDSNYNPAPQVTETVTGINSAPIFTESDPQAVTMSEDGSPLPFNLTLHATDVDGDPLNWNISSPAGHGAASVTGAGSSPSITYNPSLNYHGTDSFEVRVDDGNLADHITVNVTIDPVNDAPVITEGVSVDVTMSQNSSPTDFALTLHATDVDNGPTALNWSISTQPLHGSGDVSMGIIYYMPIPGFAGTADSFEVRVDDGDQADHITVNVILRPVLTVTADPQTITFGDGDPVFTFTYSGFVGGDGPTNVDTPPACSIPGMHVNVGTYPIQCSGGSDDQYDFIYVSDDLTIIARPVTVTADPQSKVYGMADPALTYQVISGALESGDSFSGSLTRDAGEEVGTYAITQGTLTAGSNYSLTLIGNDFSITKADQTIINVVAPASAVNGEVFTVSADATSGLPVSYSSSGTCTNTGASFTMISGMGACTVIFNQAGDANYNPAPQVTNVVTDGTAPLVISSVRADANPTSAGSVDLTVTFSEPVTGVDEGDFTLTTTGVAGAAVSGVSGSGAAYTVTVNTGTGNGTIRLDVLDDDSILDAASHPLDGGFTAGETYDVEKGNSTPPSRPTLVSPAGGSLTTDYTPLLDWNDSTVPAGTVFAHYQLQVASDSAFASITLDVDIAGVSNSAYTPPSDLASNTRFYWRVRAFNANGDASAWSLVRNFRTALLPPALIAPNDAEQLLNSRPTFDWEDVPGVSGYRIEISSDPLNFSNPVTAKNVTPSTYAQTTDLPVGVTLYWRVQSRGTNGPSAWSEVRSMTTASPPSAPALASPASNAKVSGPSPLFNWNDSTLPTGVEFDHYQIQIAMDNGFTSIVHDNNIASITNSQDNTAVLAGGTTYYWRVRAFNTLGQSSAWSSVRSVRIKFAAPALILPGTGSTISSLLPTFTWEAVSGATEYTIQVSKNSTFAGAKAINTTTTVPTYTHTATLQAGTTYYWRVRAKSPTTYAPGDWSEVFTFTTP